MTISILRGAVCALNDDFSDHYLIKMRGTTVVVVLCVMLSVIHWATANRRYHNYPPAAEYVEDYVVSSTREVSPSSSVFLCLLLSSSVFPYSFFFLYMLLLLLLLFLSLFKPLSLFFSLSFFLSFLLSFFSFLSLFVCLLVGFFLSFFLSFFFC